MIALEPPWVETKRVHTLLARVHYIVPEIFGLSTVLLVSQYCQLILVARLKKLGGDSEKLIVNNSIESCEDAHEEDEIANL